ncbi:hypothetical protein [Mycobacterium aquaticum]|uniref:Uncharacterized protein n=1 Tax=Mycobacterium aquaticum TaxID=1927124 RepID=A0A1X0ABU5_9MYCO|nr:hypothetical protein [Mycobacterium aquaticum]ORA27375.1 hypothetical protein BST13_30415 [Mycobacterium aquaticum]
MTSLTTAAYEVAHALRPGSTAAQVYAAAYADARWQWISAGSPDDELPAYLADLIAPDPLARTASAELGTGGTADIIWAVNARWAGLQEAAERDEPLEQWARRVTASGQVAGTPEQVIDALDLYADGVSDMGIAAETGLSVVAVAWVTGESR